MKNFKVSFEASGFTNSKDLVGREFSQQESAGFTEVSLKEGSFPKSVSAVLGGYVAEDDEQGDTDVHIFVRVDLMVTAVSEEQAERTKPPEDLLTKIADLIAGDLDLDLEAHSWEVAEVQEPDEEIPPQEAMGCAG